MIWWGIGEATEIENFGKVVCIGGVWNGGHLSGHRVSSRLETK